MCVLVILTSYNTYQVPDDGAREKVTAAHPGRDINICNIFYGNPSKNCRNISLKTTNLKFMVAHWVKSGHHQSHGHVYVHNILLYSPIHPRPTLNVVFTIRSQCFLNVILVHSYLYLFDFIFYFI